MPRDLIGQIFLNQFRVDRYIASGGMATIYQVWDIQRSVPLAMKVLQPELAEDPAFIARFQREANSLQKLVHPNIVPFYGLYQADGETFLLERYIDGPSLDEVLRERRGKPLPILEAMIFCKALFSSVGYAHAQGIIHCDIKPGNVLIDKGGAVYLTDFGIARYMDSSITTSAVMGTPLYMAPEQVQGELASQQTDIYSMGVVIFELLTGIRPFRGDGNLPPQSGQSLADRIRYQQVYQSAPDPREFNPHVPEGLAVAVLRALAKDPNERYPTIHAMAEEISWAIAARFDSLPDRVRLKDDGPKEPDAAIFMTPDEAWQSSYPPLDANDTPPDTFPGKSVTGPRSPVNPTRRLILILVAISFFSICALAVGVFLRAAGLGILPLGTQKPFTTPTIGVIASTPDSEITPAPSQSFPGIEPTTTSGVVTKIPTGAPGIEGEVVIVEHQDGKDRLLLVNLKDGSKTALPDVPDVIVDQSQAPQWSPDGTRLAWTSRYGGGNHIVAMQMSQGSPYQIAAGEAFRAISSPAWLPDSKRLSFWAGDGNGNWLIIADGTTGETLERVKLSEYRNLFSWNPGNDLLAFVRQRNDLYEVVISSSVTGDDSPIESGGEEYAPIWSADGEWLAFQSDAGRGNGENEIWIIRIDGSDLRKVTNSPGGTWSRAPTWSGDGKWIAYVSNQSGSRGADYGELFAVEVSSGKVVQFTDSGGQVYDWRPTWKPR